MTLGSADLSRRLQGWIIKDVGESQVDLQTSIMHDRQLRAEKEIADGLVTVNFSFQQIVKLVIKYEWILVNE